MKLFIMRHGQAESFASSDAERALSNAGCAEVRRVAQKSANELAAVEKLVVSPLRRAQQTADLVAEVLAPVPRETSDLLLPESSPSHVLELLSRQTESTVMLVSHQPLVGELVNGLCGKPNGHYAMDTAALAIIDLEFPVSSGGELVWLR